MSIVKNSVVSLHYEVYDASNQLLDRAEESVAYLHGGYSGILPPVEEVPHSKNVGDTVEVALSPDDAFGEQDPELAHIEDVSVFPVEVKVGMMFEADDPETGNVLIHRVTNVTDGKVVVDGNYPLTGMKVLFEAIVGGVCDAIEEEIAHGHVHGPYGHHHH